MINVHNARRPGAWPLRAGNANELPFFGNVEVMVVDRGSFVSMFDDGYIDNGDGTASNDWGYYAIEVTKDNIEEVAKYLNAEVVVGWFNNSGFVSVDYVNTRKPKPYLIGGDLYDPAGVGDLLCAYTDDLSEWFVLDGDMELGDLAYTV